MRKFILAFVGIIAFAAPASAQATLRQEVEQLLTAMVTTLKTGFVGLLKREPGGLKFYVDMYVLAAP